MLAENPFDDDDLGLELLWPKERTDLKCPEPGCDGMLRLKTSRYGQFYGCSNYPRCRGSHGAHPDGEPFGVPADKLTRVARQRAHHYLDRLWRPDSPHKVFRNRDDAYFWMAINMAIHPDDAHIAKFNTEQCLKLIGLLKETFPGMSDAFDLLEESDGMFDEKA
jgi:ssDNA-binding Zn-finger/Zn-ribbon topoisomerase 1